jgi:hypothetical protein
MHPEDYFLKRKYRALCRDSQTLHSTTELRPVLQSTTAVIGFTTEHYKALQQKSGFADVILILSGVSNLCHQEMMHTSSSLSSDRTLFLPFWVPCSVQMTHKMEILHFKIPYPSWSLLPAFGVLK